MTDSEPMTVRCARYGRKSTEHGLDQKFNSIEAQREACETYVISQKSKGWVLLPELYEDGGFTGANMERPGLQKLLTDIKKHKVDVVVVYKHDRLTRSLFDFAKLIEIFNEYEVSFVSVTENFNTTDSTGRLFLSMLFSFAQYEREIAAERTRDKIAASKRRGLWMGGSVPLGYDSINKELIVNESEAKIIKFIFDSFIQCNSVTQLLTVAQSLGYKTKERKTKSGIVGGNLLDKGTIYRILHNKTYLGKVDHKGNIYEGTHQAIITQEQWDKAHAIIKESPKNKAVNIRLKTPALLKGFIKCGGCNSGMVPTHTTKNGKQYPYYRGNNIAKKICTDCPVGTIPAGEIEGVVLNEIKMIFKNPAIITRVWGVIRDGSTEYSEQDVYNSLKNVDPLWQELFPAEKRRIMQSLISSVAVFPEFIEIAIMAKGINGLIEELYKSCVSSDNDKVDVESGFKREVIIREENIVIRLPVKYKRHYRGRKSISVPPNVDVYEESTAEEYDAALVKAVVRAFKWWERIEKKYVSSIDDISREEKINHGYISKILRITCLAPDILYAILDGTQPKSLILEDLTKQYIPDDWHEQRQLFGFSETNDEKAA